MENNIGFIQDLKSLVGKSPEHIYRWFMDNFASLSQADFMGTFCPCSVCHQKQFETFSRILSGIEKENLIQILIKKLNVNSHDKKIARIGLEVVMLLYNWSFLGDTCGWVDFMPGFYYQRVKNDFSRLSLEDLDKIKDKFSDSPPEYFLKMKEMGVAPEILENYLNYCYENKFQPFFNQLIKFNLSPKPRIDLKTPFQERWNKFIEEKKFRFIYLYFDLEKENHLLKEIIIHHEKMNDILSQAPTGKRFLKWKRFIKKIRNTAQQSTPADG